MPQYEIEVKVETYRIYYIRKAENKEDAQIKFYLGEGELTDEDDDTFEILQIKET